jgi:hypothetical protein
MGLWNEDEIYRAHTGAKDIYSIANEIADDEANKGRLLGDEEVANHNIPYLAVCVVHVVSCGGYGVYCRYYPGQFGVIVVTLIYLPVFLISSICAVRPLEDVINDDKARSRVFTFFSGAIRCSFYGWFIIFIVRVCCFV